jgi:hypothetical protein
MTGWGSVWARGGVGGVGWAHRCRYGESGGACGACSSANDPVEHLCRQAWQACAESLHSMVIEHAAIRRRRPAELDTPSSARLRYGAVYPTALVQVWKSRWRCPGSSHRCLSVCTLVVLVVLVVGLDFGAHLPSGWSLGGPGDETGCAA